MTPHPLLAAILAELAPLGLPQKAVAAAAYLKSDLQFLGVTASVVREVALRHYKAAGKPDRAALQQLAQAAWATGSHDARAVACVVLEKWPQSLLVADLPWLKELVRHSNSWAYVDVLAVHVVGNIAACQPQPTKLALSAWATDGNFWVRRAALLALLGEMRHGGGFDSAQFEAWAVPMLPDREFFIRKAIGWVLRDVSKRQPEFVRGFIDRHRAKMSGLTLREAGRLLA